MRNEPLDEKDFPEALDAFMVVHAELIHAVVLQSFGEGQSSSPKAESVPGSSGTQLMLRCTRLAKGTPTRPCGSKWEVMGET